MLLQVGIAAPIVATLGGSSEGAVSEQYGGVGGITAAADPVYQAIGQARSPACSAEHSVCTPFRLIENDMLVQRAAL